MIKINKYTVFKKANCVKRVLFQKYSGPNAVLFTGSVLYGIAEVVFLFFFDNRPSHRTSAC